MTSAIDPTVLVIERVPIDDVHPHPDNPREGDVGAIARSLMSNGQYRPVVVQGSTGRIIAGNHTWKAAKSLGWATVEITRWDVDDRQALRILLADNRLSDLAHYDDHALLAALQGISTDDLDGTGWDADSVTDLLNRMAPPDLDALTERFGDPDPGAVWPVVRVALPPAQFARWRALMDTQLPENDTERFIALLDLAQGAATAVGL